MATPLPAGVSLRPGQSGDKAVIVKRVLKEKMNPLGLRPERFIVAERADRPGGTAGRVVGFGQIRPLGGVALELASVVVAEEERGQGLGTALVQRLAEQAGSTPLFALTIGSRLKLYERCGFVEVPSSKLGEVPLPLALEALAGTVVAWLAVRQRLVVLRLVAGSGAAAAAAEG